MYGTSDCKEFALLLNKTSKYEQTKYPCEAPHLKVPLNESYWRLLHI